MQTETLLHFLHEPPLNYDLNELNSFSQSTGLFNLLFFNNFKHRFVRIWRVIIKQLGYCGGAFSF